MAEGEITKPVAKKVPHIIEQHGRKLSDDYAWLQNKEDPQVIAYLEAENAYARTVLAHTEAFQEQLFQEMRGRIKEDDSGVPDPYGDYAYYWRMEAGKQYRIFCRKENMPYATEHIILDENLLAEGKTYCKVFVFEPSPDNRYLAYAVDTTGALVFDLFVKDMRNGEIVSGPIPNTAWSAAWASDSQTLFYVIFDAAHRPYKLLRHQVGSPSGEDTQIFHEPDDSFFVNIRRTRSGEYIFLTISSHSTSEVRYLHADHPLSAFQLIHPRQHWLEYYLEHHGERFIIRTNEGAENFKLMEVGTADPSKSNWRTVIPHREDVLVEEVYAFRSHLAIFERQDGLERIRLSAPDGVSDVRYVQFPEPVYTIRPGDNREFDTDKLRIFYSSLATPESTVDVDLNTLAWEVKKQQEIPSGHDPSQYASERSFAVAPDGKRVPISLVYRKELVRDGSRPLLLYGYGSYGFTSDPNFDAKRFSLIDRGFIYAIAHIRGGSELGRAWYEDGRLMHKMNSFTDFIACAEHLIAQGYTSKEKLAILGGSAGGLLVSAVTNLRPDLMKAVVAMVPFTNVITAMLMPELPLTVPEYEQWGNPADPQAFEYMLSYSPYDNLTAKSYPHIYAKTGLSDLQVPYWDPAKWVARLRELKADQNRLLLVTNMGAGHGGASGRYDYLREYAQVYAFLLDTVLGS